MDIQTLLPPDYPPQLNEIPQPPKRLYIRGRKISPDTQYLAVVGSRKHSSYGKDVVRHIIRGLRGSNVCIVSGLALGIDALAHQAALDVDLPTVAIPGSGLQDRVLYPATNQPLARRILASGGSLVSEFSPDFRATSYAFPQRNRIMAGIAHGVLVIEAREQSGTLITARLAGEYNRDVFAVPGPILSPSSSGTFDLIRDGATPVADGTDILEQWGITTTGTQGHDAQRDTDIPPEEQRILAALDEPRPRDALISALGVPVSRANALLSSLELKGYIADRNGKIQRIR